MKDSTKEQLRAIFDRYSEKKRGDQSEQQKAKSERLEFLEEFDRTIKETIRPSLRELSDLIKSKGHGCEITQRSESHDAQGCIQSARVQMEILPDGFRAPAGERPTISFVADSCRKEVWTHVNTAMPGREGCSGQHNVYTLDEITRDVVEEEVIGVLTKCFG
jgi:hypothetical protein